MEPREDLESLRESLDLSQAKMAELMGVSTRSYEEIASGRSPTRALHLKAAKYGVLEYIMQMDIPAYLMRKDLKETVQMLNRRLSDEEAPPSD